ncbi:Ig-like and fibronectin type-III domain-containing protein 1 isoform X2 [Dysidea avara]|uniref:Ig-like and fibronectin type-III domain-containing protein 1 isoform X2 n=1 Tax=Dysidea avara TaxID=196820 RepID=UPI00331FFDF1
MSSKMNSSTRNYTIMSLNPGIPYQVRVVAFTSVGMGVLGHYVIFFSEELAPTKPPENIKVNYISATSINVTWTPLSLFEAQGFPKYRATLLLATEDRQRRQSNAVSLTTTNNFAVFNNLDRSAKYSVEVGVTTGETNTVINSEYIEVLQSSADSGGGGGDDGSLSIGALVGIIIAGVIFLGALVIIIVSVSIYCNRKFRNHQQYEVFDSRCTFDNPTYTSNSANQQQQEQQKHSVAVGQKEGDGTTKNQQ